MKNQTAHAPFKGGRRYPAETHCYAVRACGFHVARASMFSRENKNLDSYIETFNFFFYHVGNKLKVI